MIARPLAPSEVSATVAENPAPVYDFTDLLARRYQQGDTAVLEPLLRAVDAQVAPALAHARNHARALGGLPRALTTADLQQEAALIVAELALRWDSSRGAFGAYVRVSLPWELVRAVRWFSASRGSATVTVLSVDQATADQLANARPSADGRDWDNQLALVEALGALSPRQRAIVGLEFGRGSTLAETAARLGISRGVAQTERRRALEQLRAALTQNTPSCRGLSDTARLLDALLDGMHPNGRLPSQRAVCRHAGLSERTYDRLMAELAARGVVTGRHTRQSGRLDFAAASELLEELGA